MIRFLQILLLFPLVLSGQTTLTLPFIEDFSAYTGNPDTLKFENEGGVYINNHYANSQKSRNTATFDGLNQFGEPYKQIPAGGNANFPQNGETDYLLSLPIDLGGLAQTDSLLFSFWWQKGGISDLLKPELEDGDSLQLYFLDKDSLWQYVWPLATSKNNVINATSGDNFQVDSVSLSEFFLHENFRFMFKSYGTLTSNYDIWNINHIVLDSARNNPYLTDIALGKTPKSLLKNYYAMPYNQFKVDIQSELSTDVNSTVSSVFGVQTIVKDSTILITEKFSGTTLEETTSNVDQGISGAYILSTGETKDLTFTPNTNQIASKLNAINNPEEAFYLETNFTANFSDKIDTNNTFTSTTVIDNYYAYDDGTAEVGFGIRETGSVAVAFELKEADELRFIDLHFLRNGVDMNFSTITLRVWTSLAGIDGATETTTAVLTPVSLIFTDYQINKFLTFELSTPIVLPAGKFYVGWDQVNFTDRLLIGEDLSRNTFDKVYQNIGGVWNQDWQEGTEEGSLMIRPYFGEKRILSTGDALLLNEQKETLAYPNPCRSYLTIDNYSGLWENYTLMDLNGSPLLTGKLEIDENRLDIDLESGLYLLRVSNKFNTQTEKITVLAR